MVSTAKGPWQVADGAFEEFAATRWRQLMRAAWLLTGDWAAAEDLAQTTLTRAWTSWARVSAADEPDAYVRRMLMNEYLGQRRRRWRGEIPTDIRAAQLPEPSVTDPTDAAGRRMELVAALAELPPLQRATVVLRYFADLSIEQTAQALGCSAGNVKSQTARALRKLRGSRHLDHALRELT